MVYCSSPPPRWGLCAYVIVYGNLPPSQSFCGCCWVASQNVFYWTLDSEWCDAHGPYWHSASRMWPAWQHTVPHDTKCTLYHGWSLKLFLDLPVCKIPLRPGNALPGLVHAIQRRKQQKIIWILSIQLLAKQTFTVRELFLVWTFSTEPAKVLAETFWFIHWFHLPHCEDKDDVQGLFNPTFLSIFVIVFFFIFIDHISIDRAWLISWTHNTSAHIHKNKQPSNKEVFLSLYSSSIDKQVTSTKSWGCYGWEWNASKHATAGELFLSCCFVLCSSQLAFTQLWQTLNVEQSLSKLKKAKT